MTYTIKRGVSIFMSVEIEKILSCVVKVFRAYGLPVVVTSGLDGPHRENSLHYRFRAIDIRKNFESILQKAGWISHREMILDSLEQCFQKEKFPVLIVEEEDHIHFEWVAE